MVKISDEKMADFFNNWSDNIGNMLEKEAKHSIADLENSNYFSSRNIEKDYETMLKNLQLIFGENAPVDQHVAIFDETLNFLQQVVQVEGADRLFSKHFYGMEWNMFLEADFEKGKMKVYRDHFLHQIRNAYFGFILIWDIGFYKNIVGAFEKYKDTGFSNFISVFVEKENIMDDISKNIFFAEVIKKTWFMAALFHDIGYPISYYYRFSGRMDKYMPYLRLLDKRSQMDFVELSALLCNSYLFKMVEHDELKQKYEKLDHGMMSAVCLLLSYYHGGLIHGLSNQDRCSIELAANAIFLHTRKYSIQGEDSKWVKPCFVEDPIAYLLRVCDDLQEWSRVYFIIGGNSNIMICNNCHSLVKNSKDRDVQYSCSGCGKQFEKLTSVNYRKINLVGACEKLIINDDGKKVVFNLEYNLLKLLEVLRLDRQYAKYRYEELEELKKLFKDQLLLPKMELEYFVSNNPHKIKAEIVRKLIVCINSSVKKYTVDIFKEYRTKVEEEIMIKYRKAEIGDKDTGTFQLCIKTELDNIENYLKDLKTDYDDKGDKSDFIIDINNDSDDFLDGIFMYKIIWDIINTKYIK